MKQRSVPIQLIIEDQSTITTKSNQQTKATKHHQYFWSETSNDSLLFCGRTYRRLDVFSNRRQNLLYPSFKADRR